MKRIALTELDTIVDQFLAKLPRNGERATIVGLSGELGAGKTTFVQALGRKLGITDTMQSPTYVIMKSYKINYSGFTQFIHIDLYRLMSQDEFKTIKPDTFLNNPSNLVCVEWPERVEDVLPPPDITIKFSADGAEEGERYIEII